MIARTCTAPPPAPALCLSSHMMSLAEAELPKSSHAKRRERRGGRRRRRRRKGSKEIMPKDEATERDKVQACPLTVTVLERQKSVTVSGELLSV